MTNPGDNITRAVEWTCILFVIGMIIFLMSGCSAINDVAWKTVNQSDAHWKAEWEYRDKFAEEVSAGFERVISATTAQHSLQNPDMSSEFDAVATNSFTKLAASSARTKESIGAGIRSDESSPGISEHLGGALAWILSLLGIGAAGVVGRKTAVSRAAPQIAQLQARLDGLALEAARNSPPPVEIEKALAGLLKSASIRPGAIATTAAK